MSAKQALQRRSVTKQEAKEERARKVARAVSNYLDGTCESIRDAAKGAGVSETLVSEAVKAERARRAGKEGQS